MLRSAAVAVSLAALGLTGCGGSAQDRGRTLFAANCAACHSLRGDEASRKSGGDLLGYHLTRSVWIQYTQEMPVRRPLDERQVETVVDYVLSVQRGG